MTTLCDKNGIPQMIQRFRYHYGNFSFEATLFDGTRIELDAGNLVPSLALTSHTPTRMQFLEALNAATVFLETGGFRLIKSP